MKWRIWDDLFPGIHHTHIPSKNDTYTIGNDLITRLTPEKIHKDNQNLLLHILINMLRISISQLQQHQNSIATRFYGRKKIDKEIRVSNPWKKVHLINDTPIYINATNQKKKD